MKAYIKAISYYLPEKIYTNQDLVEDFPEWSVDKIAEKVGIDERHIAAEDETAGSMAEKAALNLFEEWNIDSSEIDFVMLCTQSPDYFLPTTACVIQNNLNIPTNSGAIDFNLGCSGYVYGLALAKGLIVAGVAKNILLLTAETYTKHINPIDKGNKTIFGDAAAATLVSTDGMAEIKEFVLGTDGKGAENLMVKTGGMKYKNKMDQVEEDENGAEKHSDYLYMNGSKIFNFTQNNVPKLAQQTLEKNNLEKSDIDLFVFHQANKYMMEFLRKKMKIEEEKFYYYMNKVGNTVSSTIPIALSEAMKEGKTEGKKIMLAGFGVGYSWAGTVLEY
ncbi:ketoacyl-ACP synthase III [Chryseobacterium aahli]|uniref:3-oxoacyl-ACP synthase III family protein n=1 Tax=Chryseobacterium aahli TaxID=1278643 RepID=UPI001F61A19D|nr:ketoacyl-ACP synthase III [Chryseobacterium aahli]MCI3936832.1 ketoacyl-ACP synthase III [Chryseobacterium aahli]